MGLRTLVMGRRLFSPQEAEDYIVKYEKAKTALSGREEQLEAVADQYESGLSLLGCSGLEDRIQVGVSEAVNAMLNGGIKIWMLTGDKQETAINVGHTITLFKSHYTVFIINISGFSTVSAAENEFSRVCANVEAFEETRRSSEYKGDYPCIICYVSSPETLIQILLVYMCHL